MMIDMMAAETHNLGNIVLIDQTKVNLSYVASYSPTLVKKCEVMAAVSDIEN